MATLPWPGAYAKTTAVRKGNEPCRVRVNAHQGDYGAGYVY